jgi:outer membrane protein TolC
MDVIRDRSIVQLNQSQVRVLDTNLQATRDRFEVGDLTRTDVAQSEARAALAQSNLAVAQGRLETSEENFQRVIGDEPAICKRRLRFRTCPTPSNRRSRSLSQQCRPRSNRRSGAGGGL